MPISIDAGSNQGVLAALSDLEHQGVRGDEREQPSVSQGPSAELLNMVVEVLDHLGDLRLGQARNAKGLDQIVHPTRGNPEQVARPDNRCQSSLRTLVQLHQPRRAVRPGAQLRDNKIQRPGPGVELPAPVTFLRIVRSGLLIPYAAPQTASAFATSTVHEQREELPQQISRHLGQLLPCQACRVHTVMNGHRVTHLRIDC